MSTDSFPSGVIGDERTCETELLHLVLVRRWAVRDSVHEGTQHGPAPGLVDAQDVRARRCRLRGVVCVRLREWCGGSWRGRDLGGHYGRDDDSQKENKYATDRDAFILVYALFGAAPNVAPSYASLQLSLP